MCGIAGIVQFNKRKIESQTLLSINFTLRDRGPDDLGFLGWSNTTSIELTRNPQKLQNPWLALIHRRLSILDLSPSGWQPMGTPDGRYYIIFNGEIYNYLELQTELQALGHTFYSQSDTEVLLKAYAQWGKQSLTRFVGMFAFAILDTQKRQLFLARDFFGIKPLYYTCFPQGFAFASEIKALLTLPQVNRQLHPQLLYNYLRYGQIDHGSQTLFADIKQIPPAHYLEIPLDDPQLPTPIRYWQIDLNQRLDLPYETATTQLRDLFLENISLHLRSDVPVGAALSGGIDSSSIVMSMRHLQGSNLQLHTFSHITNDLATNEEPWIDLVGKSAQATIHKSQPQPEELIGDLEHLIQIQDQPFGSTSIYAQYRVFRLAQQTGIKVMLDGQGADELLGGYRPYIAARLASLFRQGKWQGAYQLWHKAAQLPDTSLSQLLIRTGGFLIPSNWEAPARKLVGKEQIPHWFNRKWLNQQGITPQLFPRRTSPEVLRETLAQDLQSSLLSLLRYEDRNSMAHSIESRVPFLTPSLVTFLLSLPEEFLIAPDGTSKAIFRQAMRGIVPDLILDRKDKIGFATPEKNWLQTLYPWVSTILSSETALEIPAFQATAMQREFEQVLAGRKPFTFQIWRWVNFICWVEQFSTSFN